ncbi:MAG TPA: hypothetical protein VN654_06715 [Vicinamibacterales bacterium]|nr:hypothetical protein [Vicinamibacterales bacterium]
MAEVLASFSSPVRDDSGLYYARAVGRSAPDHLWEGWIEFVPADGVGDVLVSPIESRQPERQHLAYWATGLTPVYLEGALHRARNPVTIRVPVIDEPMSDRPAARRVVMERVVPRPEPLLDPFEIGARSIDVLRQELTALNRPRLLNIIAAYSLGGDTDVTRLSDQQLVGFIVAAVDRTHSPRSR